MTGGYNVTVLDLRIHRPGSRQGKQTSGRLKAKIVGHKQGEGSGLRRMQTASMASGSLFPGTNVLSDKLYVRVTGRSRDFQLGDGCTGDKIMKYRTPIGYALADRENLEGINPKRTLDTLVSQFHIPVLTLDSEGKLKVFLLFREECRSHLN